MIGFRVPQRAGENNGCLRNCRRHEWSCRGQFWGHMGTPVMILGMSATSLNASATSLGVPVTSLGAPPIRAEQSGKSNIFFVNAGGVPRNHSYYLSFNDF